MRNFSCIKVLTAGLVLFVGVQTEISAQLYKWVDEDGSVHYTQSPPPPGVSGSTIKPPASVDAESANKILNERLGKLDKISGNRERSAEEQQTSEQEREQQSRLCSQAKARLASYQQPRVSVTAADGTYKRLGEDERQQEISRSRQLVEELCK